MHEHPHTFTLGGGGGGRGEEWCRFREFDTEVLVGRYGAPVSMSLLKTVPLALSRLAALALTDGPTLNPTPMPSTLEPPTLSP